MKKIIIVFLTLSIIFILAACRNKQNDVISTSKVINSDNENEQEDESEEVSTSEEKNESEGENISEKEINSVNDIINLSKTMNKVVVTNIVTELTVEQQKELYELLHIEKWVKYEPEGRCASLDFIIRNDNEAQMIFLDGNAAAITEDPEKYDKIYYTVPGETVEKLKIFASKIRDEGIKNGNKHLAEQIKEFNSLIIGKPEQLYDIKEEYIYTLSEEDLKELHSMIKIEQWKVYEGSKSMYSDEDIPLTLHKYLYGEDMLLQIKRYDDLYIVRSCSYAGPTDQDYILEIPEEVYLNFINFKEKLEKDI